MSEEKNSILLSDVYVEGDLVEKDRIITEHHRVVMIRLHHVFPYLVFSHHVFPHHVFVLPI